MTYSGAYAEFCSQTVGWGRAGNYGFLEIWGEIYNTASVHSSICYMLYIHAHLETLFLQTMLSGGLGLYLLQCT